MMTPSTYIRKITDDSPEEIMVEVEPNQAVNLKAATALGLIGRSVAASITEAV